MENYQEKNKNKELERKVSNILNLLGIPSNFYGYHYLLSAIILCFKDFSKLNHMTSLYNELAKMHNTTYSSVVSSIFLAIKSGFSNADLETAKSIFGFTYSDKRRNPKTNQFIKKIVEYLNNNEHFNLNQDVESNIINEIYLHNDSNLDNQILKDEISALLKDIGISTHLYGYQYLCYCIFQYVNSYNTSNSADKLFYSNTSKKYNVEVYCVYRSIKYAILKAFETKNSKYISIFRNVTLVPTNSEFISTIGNLILLHIN